VKNLSSFFLLIGYSGFTEISTPYILFKLQEIKRNEALSFFQRASEGRLGVFCAPTPFHFQASKTINALTVNQIELETMFHYKGKGVFHNHRRVFSRLPIIRILVNIISIQELKGLSKNARDRSKTIFKVSAVTSYEAISF
jgi:hypothetical protein